MTRRGLAGVGGQYTTDGRRKSSMTHANHSWTCDCGRKVWGNGGKASHQRACAVWAAAELERVERFLADVNDPGSIMGRSALAGERRAQYEAEIATLRERLATAAARAAVKWWLIDLADETVPGGHLFPGETRRAAMKEFRHLMTEHYYEAFGNRHRAAECVTANRPTVYAGPLTPEQARAHATAWAWASAISEALGAGERAEPGEAATRDLAVQILGETRTALIEALTAADFAEGS